MRLPATRPHFDMQERFSISGTQLYVTLEHSSKVAKNNSCEQLQTLIAPWDEKHKYLCGG